MVKIKRQKKISDGMPLSTMSDIGFQLIIFFLVTSIFLVKEGLVVMLPDPEAPAEQISVEQLIDIELRADGNIYFKGEHCEIGDIPGLIRDSRDEGAESTLLIKIDGSLEYGRAVELLDIVKTTGEDRFSIRMI